MCLSLVVKLFPGLQCFTQHSKKGTGLTERMRKSKGNDDKEIRMGFSPIPFFAMCCSLLFHPFLSGFFLHLLLPSIVGQSLQTEILQLLVNKISASQFLISSLLLFIQLICSVFRIFVHLKFFPNQAQNNICFISCKDINRSQNPCASP